MSDKINVLGIEMDCLTAKEAMLRAMEFMESDSVNTIEVLSMDALMKSREDPEWKAFTESLELVLPGESAILRAADVNDRLKMKEAENSTFLKLFMKYLQKNQKYIFLLAETEEEMARLEETVRRHSRGIHVTGTGILGPDGTGEEKVINDINGTETDCVLSVLSSPYQEAFISRSRSLLSAKLWFGCGIMHDRMYSAAGITRRLGYFFMKKRFFRQAEKERK